MKVLNNKKEENPLIIKCEYCGSTLEIEDTDVYNGVYGMATVKCRVCGKPLFLDDYEGGDRYEDLEVTVDNVKFPVHFHHTCAQNGAVDISNEEIEKVIRRGVEWFRNNPEEWSWFTQFGDLTLHMYNYSGDEEFLVIVSKDYYETTLSYQPNDYELFEEYKE